MVSNRTVQRCLCSVTRGSEKKEKRNLLFKGTKVRLFTKAQGPLRQQGPLTKYRGHVLRHQGHLLRYRGHLLRHIKAQGVTKAH